MARPNQGPHLGERPNAAGVWEIRWTVDGRSRHNSTGCRNLKDARAVLAAFTVGFAAATARSSQGLTFAEALVAYWREHVEPKVNSVDTAAVIAKHLAQHFAAYTDPAFKFDDPAPFIAGLALHTGGLLVSEIDDDVIADYEKRRRAGKIGRPVGDGTIRRELTVLNAILNRAWKKKRVARGDVTTAELPQLPEARDRWLTDDEMRALQAAALAARGPAGKLNRTYLFIVLARYTAARLSALRTLTWFQVDLERRLIRLNPRGRRQTTKRRPLVPIADALYPILVRARAEATTEFVLGTDGCIRGGFENAVARAGLRDVTPHTLRHTWATRAAQNGVPLYDIAGMLGDTLETVQRNYLHHCPEHLRSAANHGAPVLDAISEEE